MALSINNSVHKTAQGAGYKSETALCTQFKRVTGYTLTEFKENNPFIKARSDMLETSKPLMEIAIKRGFGTGEILKVSFEIRSQKAAELSLEEYRNHLKVWRAERLLRRTGLDEKHIAGAIGFEDVDEFRTFFKEGTKTKVLPLDYRKQAANDANLQKPQPQVA